MEHLSWILPCVCNLWCQVNYRSGQGHPLGISLVLSLEPLSMVLLVPNFCNKDSHVSVSWFWLPVLGKLEQKKNHQISFTQIWSSIDEDKKRLCVTHVELSWESLGKLLFFVEHCANASKVTWSHGLLELGWPSSYCVCGGAVINPRALINFSTFRASWGLLNMRSDLGHKLDQ